MNTVIGFITPDAEVKERAEKILKDEVKVGKLLVRELRFNSLKDDVHEMIKSGAQAIIARGGTYNDITSLGLSVPVIDIGFNVLDILRAVTIARKFSKKIVIILLKNNYFNMEEWKDLIKVDIDVIRLDNVSDMDVELDKIKERNENVIIVGGAITVEASKARRLDASFINLTNASIVESYNRTIKLIEEVYAKNLQINLLSGILENITDAVLVIDENGYLTHFNSQLTEFFPEINETKYNRDIIKEIEDIKFVFDVFEGKKILNHIVKANGYTLNVNAVPLKIFNKIHGVLCTIQDTTKIQKLEEKLRYKLNEKGLTAKHTFDDIHTIDKDMKSVISMAKEYAKTDFTVMLYGESGTGKEMFAQSIHNTSIRKTAPFVAVNCAALSENLLESEIFGYVEGAFTGAKKGGKQGLFELAHKGSIFLDEVNSMPLKIQSKLLRVIEEKEVMRLGSDYVIPLDVRIIVASNEELIDKVNEGEFRSDLFYRLSVLEIFIPPLAKRPKDIIPFFRNFLRENGIRDIEIPKEFQDKLKNHPWKGNVRELKNIAERYSILKDKYNYHSLGEQNDITPKIIGNDMRIDLKELNKVVENLVITSLLNKGVSKTQIAGMLGISRTALWKKISKNEIE